jgi:hypothetical protein
LEIHPSDTAVVFIDPQNDVLSENGGDLAAVGASVTENALIRLFADGITSGSQILPRS